MTSIRVPALSCLQAGPPKPLNPVLVGSVENLGMGVPGRVAFDRDRVGPSYIAVDTALASDAMWLVTVTFHEYAHVPANNGLAGEPTEEMEWRLLDNAARSAENAFVERLNEPGKRRIPCTP